MRHVDLQAPDASRDNRAALPVICGPTAAGKSALAIALAQRYNGAIISADSRQIYRGFDIGTAKPDPFVQRAIPHFGIDVAEPTERYSAARWAAGAAAWISNARRAGRTPVVVGGTGFYIRALTEPLFQEPDLDPERRRLVARELDAMPSETLRRWCARLDPPRAHLGRVQLTRAIEVALLTGTRISEWHAAHTDTPGAPAEHARYLLVDSGHALRERIVHRLQQMIAAGWEREVASLVERVPENAPAWNATGYSTVRDFVHRKLTFDEAFMRIMTSTRQYAKRQRTWFRHQLPATSVTLLDSSSSDALGRAEKWWEAGQ